MSSLSRLTSTNSYYEAPQLTSSTPEQRLDPMEWDALEILAKVSQLQTSKGERALSLPTPIETPPLVSTTPQEKAKHKCEKCGYSTFQVNRFMKHKDFDFKTNTYIYACEKKKSPGSELTEKPMPPPPRPMIVTFSQYTPPSSSINQEKDTLIPPSNTKRVREEDESSVERATKKNRLDNSKRV